MITVKDIIEKVSLRKTGLIHKSFPAGTITTDTVLQAIMEIGKSYERRFVIDSQNRDIYEQIALWWMASPDMRAINPDKGTLMAGRLTKGIYLAGNTGSGKTLAMRILSTLYATNSIQDIDGKVLAWKEQRADEICTHYASSGDLTPYLSAKVLCIQDLGSEPAETLYMGNRVNVIRSIIEHRGDYPDLVTFATSNIPLTHQDLITRYGDRAVSRLKEMMNYLILKGRDRRQDY